MNYPELRDLFVSTLNRTDLTTTQADQFIELGTTRAERRLRTTFQKHSVSLTLDANSGVSLPADLLAFVSVRDKDGIVPRVGNTVPGTRGYYVDASRIICQHGPGSIDLTYYRQFPRDTEETPQSSIIPDVILYSALTYAAIHFMDERLSTFEGMFNSLLAEVQLWADEIELSGHPTIRNPYEGYV